MANNFRSVKNVVEPYSNLSTEKAIVFGKVNNSIQVAGNTLPGDKPFKVIELTGEEIPDQKQLKLKDSNGNIWKASEDIEIIGAEMSIHYTDSVSGSIIPSRFRVGDDIDGKTASDRSGRSVAMSGDGTRIAIGAMMNDGINGTDSGHVRVYDWDGSSWVQTGNDIYGEAADDRSGFSVAMSNDGTRIAIGAIFNDGNSGTDTVSGHVRVYDWNGSSWNKLGQDIDGEAADDQSGYSVAMSSDGNRIAIGAKDNDGNSGNINDNRGHVRVYDWDGSSSSWVQTGNDIYGEAANDQSGWAVAMSGDGNRIAIGATNNNGINGTVSGHVRVHDWNGSSWNKIGQDIDGEAKYNWSGYSVAMSNDGNRIAIGATGNDGINGTDSGHVRVYDWDGSSWVQTGNDIDGEAADDQSGYSVAMSSDGTRIAIGAIFNDGINGNVSGHVRVYAQNVPRTLNSPNPIIQSVETGKLNVSSLYSSQLGSSGTPVITLSKDEGLDISPVGLHFLVHTKVKLYYR